VEKPKVQPEPKKAVPPRDEPQQSADDFSDSILKTLNKSAPQAADNAPPAPRPAPAASGDSLSNVLAADELSALKRQIGQCWNFPAGASNAEQLIVTVRVTMNPDRTVQNASIASGAGAHPMARQAEESALRAILSPACSPLLLPPDKFAMWQTFTLRFDPRFMLGY
jgi:outer membrane biosynthesis protein TonB